MSNFYDQYDENADVPLTEEHLQQCRSRKTAMEQKNSRIFWAHILMGGLLFVLSMFTSAIVGRDSSVEGPQKFYVGFTLAFAQILLALATIGFGTWAYMKHRVPTYTLMGLFIVHIFYTLLASYDYLNYVYILYDAVGLVLNYLRLSVIGEHEWLKKQPGYPYFSEAVLRSNEYELPKHITHRRPPSDDMDSIGDAAAPKTTLPQLTPSEDTALADMSVPEIAASEVKLPPPVVLRSHDALESLQESITVSAAPEAPRTEPSVSADDMLADMTVPETAKALGALPDPEEVKARLRQMAAQKQSRESSG